MKFYDDYKKELKQLDSSDVLFTKSQAAELTGLTPRSIHFYTDEGLVIPAVNPRGKGTTRKYSRFNLFELLVVRELIKYNVVIRDLLLIMRKGMTLRPKVMGPGPEYLVLFDHNTEDGTAIHTAADKDGYLKVNMSGRSGMVAIEISSLRIKAGRF